MIKLDVISGFLGAGKTTFIKDLLGKGVFDSEKVVILENEYGEVNMDSKFLGETNIPVYEITKGCICCSLQDDFVTTLQEIDRAITPDRVIIEPSGIFMLETLFELLQTGQLRHSYQLGSVISIVDVTLFDGRFIPMEGIISNQIKFADRVLLSKSDDDINGNAVRAKDFIRQYNDSADIHVWSLDDQTDRLKVYLDGGKAASHICNIQGCGCGHHHDTDHKTHEEHDGHHHHNHEHHHPKVMTETIEINGILEMDILENFVKSMKEGLFGDIIRMKGVLDVAGDSYECHYVNGTFNKKKVTSSGVSSLVVIGESIDRQQVRSFF